jgi:hypothetical protein
MKKITKKHFKLRNKFKNRNKHTISNNKNKQISRKNIKHNNKKNKKTYKRGGMNFSFKNPFTSSSAPASTPSTPTPAAQIITPVEELDNPITNDYLDKFNNKDVFLENIKALAYIDPYTWKLLIKDGIQHLQTNDNLKDKIKYDEKKYIDQLNCPKAKSSVPIEKDVPYDEMNEDNITNNEYADLLKTYKKGALKIKENIIETIKTDIKTVEDYRKQLVERIDDLIRNIDSFAIIFKNSNNFFKTELRILYNAQKKLKSNIIHIYEDIIRVNNDIKNVKDELERQGHEVRGAGSQDELDKIDKSINILEKQFINIEKNYKKAASIVQKFITEHSGNTTHTNSTV